MLPYDLNLILSLIFGAFVLFLIVRFTIRPTKFLIKLMGKIMLGVVLLLVTNLVLGFLLDIQIAINLMTSLIAGFLGIPGVLMMLGIVILLTG